MSTEELDTANTSNDGGGTLYRVPDKESDSVQDADGLTLADMKDLRGLKLRDIASGPTSTGFIFEREDGSLTGFQVPLPREGIAPKDFVPVDDSEMTEVEIE